MSERPRPIRPGRLRRRLTLAFALTAGIAAAALAAGSFLLVREARLSDSRDRAVEQTRFNLVLASEVLPVGGARGPARRLRAARELRDRPPRGRHRPPLEPLAGRGADSARPGTARRRRAAGLRANRGGGHALPRHRRAGPGDGGRHGVLLLLRGGALGRPGRACGTSCSRGSGSSSSSPGSRVRCSPGGRSPRLRGRARRRTRSPRVCSTPASRSRARTSSAPGRRPSTRWPRRWRRRSPRSPRPRRASGASPPTSRTSCARR